MRVAVLGHGTVGRGVVGIIDERVSSIEVVRILDLPDRCTEPRMTSNVDDILNDASIDAVVECMGGLEPARTYILSALERGMSVVTSNKAVVAANFAEFAKAADEGGASLFIEACVGGGIPWISSIVKAGRIDDISSFSGILNGTTNYVIDQMDKGGMEFAEALARAQELGYAERDPSADIDGIDVYNKTVITASVAFGVNCTHDFPVIGIRNLTKADMEVFKAHGLSVKLMARGVKKDGRYAVAVVPTLVPVASVEACIPDNFNIATLEGDTVGTLKFYGQGAGSLPTGNAMVQDLLDLASGVRPRYRLDNDLVYDPSLLDEDYVVRCEGLSGEPHGRELAPGYKIIHSVREAGFFLEDLIEDSHDTTAFMAALPGKDEA